MVAGHMTMGNMASRLERAGIAPSYVIGIGVGASALVQAALVLGFSGMQSFIWPLCGFLGTAGSVSFAIVSRAFPAAMAGRANTALNLLVFVTSFMVQWGMGIVINLYPAARGSCCGRPRPCLRRDRSVTGRRAALVLPPDAAGEGNGPGMPPILGPPGRQKPRSLNGR
jgi:hypothetical protein